MSGLYLYALVEGAPRGFSARGVANRPVKVARVAGFTALVTELAEGVDPSLKNLAAHDRVVRKAWRDAKAVLPIRFGTLVDDRRALERALGKGQKDLRGALGELAHRAQFALRLVGPREEASAAPRSSGAAYLKARAKRHEVPELDAVVAAAGSFVRAQRSERPAAGPIVAAVFHLVDRQDARAYVRAVKRVPHPAAPLRLVFAGPGPGWAFAPEVSA